MKDRSAAMRRCRANLEAIKRPKEVSLGEHTSLGPKATAPITVICLSPDLTLGVSSSLTVELILDAAELNSR